jgi:cyclic pyranopterin phosphate synthase
MLIDRFDRPIENLRISVTDRCDLRCFYCIPDDDIEWLPRAEILTLEEIARAAGLHRINISLDSLRKETFALLAKRDRLDEVLAGIAAAEEVGMRPIRINTVLVRGINDDEALDFVALARDRGFEWRFIEFMPLEAGRVWGENRMISGTEVRARIEAVHSIVPDSTIDPSQPSRDFVFADGSPGKVGFIDSVTEPFCRRCNRIRLTADGKIRTCLFSVDEIDLMSALRSGGTDDDLVQVLHAAVARKEKKHHITDGLFVKPERTMSRIGG